MTISTSDCKKTFSRRSILAGALGGIGWENLTRAEEVAQQIGKETPIARKDPLKITRLETFLVKPRWLFLKVHTNAGIIGLGKPILEGRVPAQIGKDHRACKVPRRPRQGLNGLRRQWC